MGRRTTRKTVRKPTAPKLETSFDCPICNHENVVQCRVGAKTRRGTALCGVCESNFTCQVTGLDKPIDVYHAWIDKLTETKEDNVTNIER